MAKCNIYRNAVKDLLKIAGMRSPQRQANLKIDRIPHRAVPPPNILTPSSSKCGSSCQRRRASSFLCSKGFGPPATLNGSSSAYTYGEVVHILRCMLKNYVITTLAGLVMMTNLCGWT